MSWLDDFLAGFKNARSGGAPIQRASTVNFGAGLQATSDGTTMTVTGTGSAPLLVTALVTTPPLDATAQQFYVAAGYAISGDGGGGTFVWNATDTRADDGGTIIKVAEIVTGRWNRVYSGALDVRWWGADPTGAADSTAAIQAAINAGLATVLVATIFFVSGTYKVSSTLMIIGAVGASVNVNLKGGAGVAGLGTQGAVLQWVGGLSPMVLRELVTEATDSDITFDGGATALTCMWQQPTASGPRYERCVYGNTKVFPYWTAGMAVTVNVTHVLVPKVGSAYPDNGHLYLCTNAGSGTTAGAPTTFPTTAGASSTADGNGVVWTESGPSPAAFLVGALVFPNGDQCDTTRWNQCYFSGGVTRTGSYGTTITGGGAGWRPLGGGNVKDFALNQCAFVGCAIGIDWNFGSGFGDAHSSAFAGNGLDIRSGTAPLTVDTWSSESSSMLLYGSLGSSAFSSVSLRNGEWEGNSVGSNAPFIKYGGHLVFEGNRVNDTNASNTFPIIQVDVGSGAWSVRSAGNNYVYASAYTGPYFFPLFDTAGTSLVPDSQAFGSTYVTLQLPFSSQGDKFESSTGGGLIDLQALIGSDIASVHQQLYADQALRVAGVSTAVSGKLVGSYAEYAIDYTAPKAFTTAHLVLARPQNGCKVKAVYVFVDTAFNEAGTTVAIGKIFQTGGTVTANAFLVASDVTVPTNTSGAPIGSASGDLGADLSGAAQGGVLYWGTAGATSTWEIIATFAGAGLASLTAGSLRVLVEYENLF